MERAAFCGEVCNERENTVVVSERDSRRANRLHPGPPWRSMTGELHGRTRAECVSGGNRRSGDDRGVPAWRVVERAANEIPAAHVAVASAHDTVRSLSAF